MKSRAEKIETVQTNTASREVRGDLDQLKKLEREGHGHCREAKKLRRRLYGKQGEEAG